MADSKEKSLLYIQPESKRNNNLLFDTQPIDQGKSLELHDVFGQVTKHLTYVFAPYPRKKG